MKEYLSKLKGKIKALWARFKTWLIKRLGGYTFPPTVPEIKAEQVETVKVSASLMVDTKRYNTERTYRAYIYNELARIVAEHILNEGVLTSEKMIDFDDLKSVVKASATLVKGGQQDGKYKSIRRGEQ